MGRPGPVLSPEALMAHQQGQGCGPRGLRALLLPLLPWEPRDGPSWNSRLEVGVAVWAVILRLSLYGEMSGKRGTGLRKMSPDSLEKEMGSLSAVTHALPGISSTDSLQGRNR